MFQSPERKREYRVSSLNGIGRAKWLRLKAKLIDWIFQNTNLVFGYAVDYDENRNITGIEVQWDLLGKRKKQLLKAADDELHVMGTVLFPQKEGTSHEDR